MNNQNQITYIKKDSQNSAHPYPYSIAMTAETFAVGSIFYYSFIDVVSGEYFHSVNNPYEKIKNKYIKDLGVSEQVWEENFKAFQAYLKSFPNPIIQNALLCMIMHWDWYIRKLGKFVEFVISYDPESNLKKSQKKELHRISKMNIVDQVKLLSSVTHLSFGLSDEVLSHLNVMSSVRNIGMHNHWIIDEKYCHDTNTPIEKIGSLRQITTNDLFSWKLAISSTIHSTASMIALKYVYVPSFSS